MVKAGKPVYNYNNKIGISTYANRPDFVSGPEWLQLRQEAWENDGNTGKAPLPGGLTWEQASKNNTDWWDQLTRNGFINEHSLSMTQGNKLVKSFVGATYSENQSYLKNNSYVRMGLRTNFDFTITPKFKANPKRRLQSRYQQTCSCRVGWWFGRCHEYRFTDLSGL